LAGDLLPNATLEQKVASGYNRMNMITTEGGAQAKEYLAKYAADRVRTTSTTWMGATMGCCECHDHKFDPIPTKDFYRMGAFFADIQEGSIADRDPGILVPTDKEAADAALGRDTDATVFDDLIETQDKARAVEDVTLGHKDALDAALEQAEGGAPADDE